MRVKKVNRYYCEHCKKSGCSAGHMRKHEERCTLNPNRKCGMCAMVEGEQPDLKKLIALLPDPSEWSVDDGTIVVAEVVEAAMLALRKAADNCPACILAALRQRGIPIYAVGSFNFTKECQAWWTEFNDAKMAEDQRASHYG